MDDYVIDGDLVFSNQRSALKFYREQYHKKKEWVGLTDKEIEDCLEMSIHGTCRAIEAKLKEKNT